MMDIIELWTICSANGIILDKKQIEQLERYTKELIFWNGRVNLISRKDEQFLLEHHIIHSLSMLKYLEFEPNAYCLDVGTGGGLPGIPLAIARPNTYFLLVDSIAKKMKITSMLAKHTELKKIQTICSRVEDLSNIRLYRNAFDYIISRAVGSIKSIIKNTIKLTKLNTKYIFLKGGYLTNEIKDAQSIFKNYYFEEVNIDFIGFEWFKKENKKIIIALKK